MVTKPFQDFVSFMSSKNYVEPDNGGKYGATAGGDGEAKAEDGEDAAAVEEEGDAGDDDDAGSDDDEDDDDNEEEDDEDEDEE